MKIPKQAKKVFTGEIFDVYQWPQKMFDGSTETFERLKRPNTLSTIAIAGDKIILNFEQQPNSGKIYALPGGRQEKNESPLQGAKREFLEETGHESKKWNLYKKYDPLDKIEWTIYYFIAKNCFFKQTPVADPGEKIKNIKVGFEEFVKIVLSDKFWGKEFAFDIARMKLNNKLGDFKKMLFEK
jgi:ADP-ribose pyrophosphatase YjhB (NUDIX family)